MAGVKGSQRSLHERIYLEIKADIEQGALAADTQLPTELELAQKYSVSRGTARQAITRLVNEGLVERMAGRGTFVTPRRLNYTAHELLGFSQQIRDAGLTPSSELVDLGLVGNTNGEFGPRVERLVRVERVRKANGEPVALEELFLPWPRFAGLRDMDVEEIAIYDTLETVFGVRLGSGEFTIDLVELDDRRAGLLMERAGAAAFLMHGVVSDDNAQPIVRVRCYYRRSRYSVQFTVRREQHDAPGSMTPRPVMTGADS